MHTTAQISQLMESGLQSSPKWQKPSEDTPEAESRSGMGNGPEHARRSQDSRDITPKPRKKSVSTNEQSSIDTR